jgi:Ala-tRNA(Pro) deacylase
MEYSERQQKVLQYLDEHSIAYSCYNHPEGKTIEEAKRWWRNDGYASNTN